jgi:hypothetical protein
LALQIWRPVVHHYGAMTVTLPYLAFLVFASIHGCALTSPRLILPSLALEQRVDRITYCSREIWRGSHLELGLEYHSTATDQLLLRATQALWRYPGLSGPWPSREDFGNSIQITSDMLPRDSMLWLYGLLELPEGRKAACSSFLLRPNDGSSSLTLCLPAGMLERLFTVAYNPMSVKTNPWLREIETLLVDIADWVYGTAPFQLGVLGEEAATVAVDAEQLTSDALATGGFIMPDELWRRLEPPIEARRLSHALRHIPLNY